MNVSLGFPRPQTRFSSLSSSAAGKAADKAAGTVTIIQNNAILKQFEAKLLRTPGTHCLGRGNTNTLQLLLPIISRDHLEIKVDANYKISVRDLNSSNGTALKDENGIITRVYGTWTDYNPKTQTLVLSGFGNQDTVEIPPFKDF